MKKLIYLIVIIVFSLAACQQKANSKDNEKTAEKKNIQKVTSVSHIKPYRLNAQQLHTVVGFLSEVDVLIIERQPEEQQLIRYNLLSGRKKLLYTTKEDIIQAFIHPSMKEILLQTSSDSKNANVTILTSNGKTLHNFKVKSQELSLVWNPNNANLLAVAAFSNDLSYKSYIFDGNHEQLHEFQSENPFWTWSTDDILWINRMGVNPYNGGTLISIDWENNKVIPKSEQKVVYISCFKQSKLIVTMDFEHEEFKYVLQKGTQKQTWNTSAVSNYAQWFVPEVQWLDDQSFIALLPMKNGELDDGEHPFKLVHATLNGIQELGQYKNYEPTICSAKGTVCLSGFNYEKLITTKPYKKKNWLLLKK